MACVPPRKNTPIFAPTPHSHLGPLRLLLPCSYPGTFPIVPEGLQQEGPPSIPGGPRCHSLLGPFLIQDHQTVFVIACCWHRTLLHDAPLEASHAILATL